MNLIWFIVSIPVLVVELNPVRARKKEMSGETKREKN
jgi:hypothetical protein